MNTNETPPAITPLQLANLSAVLLQAQVIDVPKTGLNSNLKIEERMLATAAAALDYLKVCTSAIAQQLIVDKDAAAADEVRIWKAKTAKFLAAYKGAGVVPVVDIVTHCNAQNIVLSRDELKAIGDTRKWPTMSSDVKKECVFLALTSKACSRPISSLKRVSYGYHPVTRHQSQPALSLAVGREFVKSGVPLILRFGEEGKLSAAETIELILMAKNARLTEKGRKGAAQKKIKKPL